jgi:hypothetical protein
MKILILLLLTISSAIQASTVSIPLSLTDTSKKPSNDLIYNGEKINAYEAFKLQKQGMDLSTLNPNESTLWQNTKHELEQVKTSETEFEFTDYKLSPSEIFRSVITAKNSSKRFVLTAALDNHTNIIRAGILNLVGYDISIPRFYKRLKVNFKSRTEKELFLKKLGEQTLTKRTRWVEKDEELTLTLKGITLGPAKLKNVNIFLPVMTRERQKERRVFRALLNIYALTDFPQSINAISWKIGRKFNKYLIINHPFAQKFRDVSLADISWIQKKLNKLSRAELSKVVKLASYPDGIRELVLEKILSRMNSLNEHVQISHRFSVKRKLNAVNIKNGKLISNQYQESVVNYFKTDKDSPYNYKDLFKLFRTQMTYNALSKVLSDAVEKFVPGVYTNDAVSDIQDQINEYRINNQVQSGSMPLKVFSYPTAYVNATANRNIVFGAHLGSSAPIQLVDSVSAAVNLGLYNMITGVSSDITPSISAGVTINRSYTHVRGMPDLATATDQSIKKVLVPTLLKSVGEMLRTEFKCSLSNIVNVIDTQLQGNRVIYIKYDKNITDAKEQAITRRATLIEQGVSENIILLVPTDRATFCNKEIENEKDENLEQFLREFADNEVFLISDSISLMSNLNVSIPLDAAAGVSLTANIGGDISKGLIKSVIIRKKESSIDVTIQQQKDSNKQLHLGLSFFVEIVKNSTKWFTGEMETKIYTIPTGDISAQERQNSLNAIRELFTSNSTHYLEEYYNPVLLDHDLEGKLNAFKLLWYKNESLVMDHYVDITLPQQNNLSLEQRTKTLYSTRAVKRDGKDYFGLLSSIVTRISRFINLGGSEIDPGKTIKGSSKSRYYVSEGEISTPINSSITTKVDYVWKGWSAKYSKLNSMFNFIEGLFEETQVNYSIDRNRFKNMSVIKNYEVRTTFIVYPEFIEKFHNLIISSEQESALAILKDLYGSKKWQRYCSRRKRMTKRTNTRRKCIPGPVKRLLKLRKMTPLLARNKLVKQQNKIVMGLLEGFDRKRVLSWIGESNFFSSTRVTGFIEHDEKGYIDYISNSYGHYNSEHGTGVFDSIAALIKISPFALRALNYTPGM